MTWPSFPCPSVTKAEYISSNVQALRMASISPFASKITCARADTQTCGCAAAFCARPATKTAVTKNLEHKRLSIISPSEGPFGKQSPAARGRLYDRVSLAEERQRWNAGLQAGPHGGRVNRRLIERRFGARSRSGSDRRFAQGRACSLCGCNYLPRFCS